MGNQPRTWTVAAAQLPARPLDQAARSLTEVAEAVAAAARAGAELVVLPECCYPCYQLGTRQRYFEAPILRGPEPEAFVSDLARRHRIHVVAGLVHERDGRLYDAAVLFDPRGEVRGRHFKTFLWDREHDWYERGQEAKTFDTPLGRMGLVICAEGRLPELFAAYALQAAQLLAMPTAWVNAAPPGEFYNPQPDFLVRARAMEFGLPLVCANKCGQEGDDARFCGMSLIVAGDGRVLAQAPPDAPALLVERIELAPRPEALQAEGPPQPADSARPVLPDAAVGRLRVALASTNALTRVGAPDRENLFHLLRRQEVRLLVTAATLDSPAWGDWAAPRGPQRISTPAEPGLVRLDRALIGRLPGEQAGSFVVPRRLALAGAHLLCMLGPLPDLSILQARALENRVFVVAAAHDQAVAVAPDGSVLVASDLRPGEPVIVELDLGKAADKLVAPATDIWDERGGLLPRV